MKHLHFSPSTVSGKAKLFLQAKPSSTFLSVQTNSPKLSMALHHWDEPGGGTKEAFRVSTPGEMKVKRTELETHPGFGSSCGADALCPGCQGSRNLRTLAEPVAGSLLCQACSAFPNTFMAVSVAKQTFTVCPMQACYRVSSHQPMVSQP